MFTYSSLWQQRGNSWSCHEVLHHEEFGSKRRGTGFPKNNRGRIGPRWLAVDMVSRISSRMMHGPPHFSRVTLFFREFYGLSDLQGYFWGGSATWQCYWTPRCKWNQCGNGASKWGTRFWQVEKGVGEVEKGVRKAENWVRKAEKAMHVRDAYKKAVSTRTRTVPLAPVITQTSERWLDYSTSYPQRRKYQVLKDL